MIMNFNEKFFDLFMLPLERAGLRTARRQLVGQAQGRVLEIGAGTGSNLPFYRFQQVDQLIISDYQLTETVKQYPFPEQDKISFLEIDVTSIPLEDNSLDCVVFSLVFCTVSDPDQGFREIYRVLKPGGRILFIEHVLPEDHRSLSSFFHFLNPAWRHIAHGCNLNRRTVSYIQEAGFEIQHSHRFFKSIFAAGVGRKPSENPEQQVSA